MARLGRPGGGGKGVPCGRPCLSLKNRVAFSRFWFARMLRYHISHHVCAKESPAQRHREGGNLLGRPGKGRYLIKDTGINPIKEIMSHKILSCLEFLEDVLL
jgi:hypothetical protein